MGAKCKSTYGAGPDIPKPHAKLFCDRSTIELGTGKGRGSNDSLRHTWFGGRNDLEHEQATSAITSGYLLATWKEIAQRADAGNPLILLVSALGLEPKTL